MELNAARGGNGFGLNPLSHAELADWRDLTGTRLDGLTLILIRRFDAEFLAWHSQPDSQRGKADAPSAASRRKPQGA